MILKVFAIRDSKIEAYNPPMVFRAIGEAMRFFSDIASDPKSNIGKHPEDFALFELGTFDDATAKFEMLPQPHSHGLASDLSPMDRAPTLQEQRNIFAQ